MWKIFCRSFWLVVLATVSFAQDLDNPVVETKSGKVKGSHAESRDGRVYDQFLGIPYAIAQRFQAPVKHSPWNEVRDSTAFGPVCAQFRQKTRKNQEGSFIGEEDCLTLNVFSPRVPDNNGAARVLHPVMVWLHGGNFRHGSGNFYGPQYFMDKNMVLVTMNYRVGALGNLNVGHKLASGNQGLKDQVAALRWVQENIEAFGGDKDRVLLAGQGSGAASVQYHMMSPLSTGLFQRALVQSGSALSPGSFVRNPFAQAKEFAKAVGCPADSQENLIDCLKDKKPEELVLPEDPMFDIPDKDKTTVMWGPSIESAEDTVPFLSSSPFVLWVQGNLTNKVPMVSGINSEDGAIPMMLRILSQKDRVEKLNDEWEALAPIMLGYQDAVNSKEISKKIKNFYFGGKKIEDAKSMFKALDLASDRYVNMPMLTTGVLLSNSGTAYPYIITYSGNYSVMNEFETGIGEGQKLGSAFMDEVQYEFAVPELEYPEISKKCPDYEFSKNFIDLIASYAENGKPTKLWGAGYPTWEKHDPKKSPAMLKIDAETSIYTWTDDRKDRAALWRELYSNELKYEFQNPPKEEF